MGLGTISTVLATLMLGLLPLASLAQHYPNRPIRLLLGVAAGGGQDTVARAMAPKVSNILGANIVMDNRPGAGGDIATGVAMQAAPDGYTLLMISSSNVIRPLMYKSPYNLQRDFAPIAQLINQPYLLVTPSTLSVKSVTELIADAKSNPGKINFGSAGNGTLTHLAAELFKDQAQIEAVHVPYKGAGSLYPDLIAGRVQFSFSTIVSALVHVRTNRLLALAVSSPKRVPSIPDIPTVAESGLPGYAVSQWYAVLAPKGVPQTVIEKVNKALVTVLQDPELAKHLTSDGAVAASSSPAELATHLKSETERWSRIVKKAGLLKE